MMMKQPRLFRSISTFAVVVIVIICGCNPGKETNGISACQQDLIVLEQWIHVPDGTKSATWKLIREGGGFGPSTTILVCVMEMDTTFMRTLNLNDREREEGDGIRRSWVEDCFAKELSNSFFKAGITSLEPKGPAFSSAEFQKGNLSTGYFVKLNEAKIFLYLISD